MNKKFFAALLVMIALGTASVFAQSNGQPPASGAEVAASSEGLSSGFKYLAAALAVGIACIGGGMAVGKIGAAAMGAMSENAELSGKAIPFVGLAEGICLWGFLVALFIILL